MADDAVNRGLSVEQANPFLGVETLKYLGDEVGALVSIEECCVAFKERAYRKGLVLCQCLPCLCLRS